MLFCRLLIFFQINLFEKFYQEYHQSAKQFRSRSEIVSEYDQEIPQSQTADNPVAPDLDSNFLQKLSADDTSRQES